jgi:hypothetical protein
MATGLAHIYVHLGQPESSAALVKADGDEKVREVVQIWTVHLHALSSSLGQFFRDPTWSARFAMRNLALSLQILFLLQVYVCSAYHKTAIFKEERRESFPNSDNPQNY